MNPIGMDKNSVLVYKDDKVLYRDEEWNVDGSDSELFVYLSREESGLNFRFYITLMKNIEVVNVSERTNYERYFADLCLLDEMYGYICRGSICDKCIVNESLCVNGRTFTMWLNEPAVKL